MPRAEKRERPSYTQVESVSVAVCGLAPFVKIVQRSGAGRGPEGGDSNAGQFVRAREISMAALIKSAMIKSFALVLSACLVLSTSLVLAEDRGPEFKQEELDQMLAPIALYPDSLLSQILMASTYPLEVVQAARWSRANPDLTGEQAVRAVDDRDWDPSVKSLVAFPQILTMMDQKLEWTQRLGDAFLAQQSQVMDTVQDLRQKAYAAGNLRSNEHYRVVPQGRIIVVESPYPEVIYVPYYDPLVVYGPWWWPAYPPIYWAPWPGYYAYPGFVGFHWSVGIAVGPAFFFGVFDWHHRHVTVVHVNRLVVHHHPAKFGRVTWKHDPGHRRGVPYRHAAVREKFAPSWRSDHEARSDFRQRDSVPVASRESVQRPADVRSVPDRRSDLRRDAAADPQQRGAASTNRFVTEGDNRRGDPRGMERRAVERDSGFTGSEPRRLQLNRPAVAGHGGRIEPRVTTDRPRDRERPFANREAPRAQPGHASPQGPRMPESVPPLPSAGGRDSGPRMERGNGTRMRESVGPLPSAGGRDPGPRMERGNFRGNSARPDSGGRGQHSQGTAGGRS